jgi:uncharacterized protein (DUF2141 family)
MKKVVRWMFVAVCLCPIARLAKADEPAEGVLSIEVVGTKSEKGNLVAFLWDQPKGFPSDSKRKIAMVTIPATKAACTIRFEELQPDRVYAVSIMHDENANGVMDSNLFGIPKEGYATSRNVPHSMLGPPKFDEASFRFSKSSEVKIKMLY